jgi:hypothetical protein
MTCQPPSDCRRLRARRQVGAVSIVRVSWDYVSISLRDYAPALPRLRASQAISARPRSGRRAGASVVVTTTARSGRRMKAHSGRTDGSRCIGKTSRSASSPSVVTQAPSLSQRGRSDKCAHPAPVIGTRALQQSPSGGFECSDQATTNALSDPSPAALELHPATASVHPTRAAAKEQERRTCQRRAGAPDHLHSPNSARHRRKRRP